MNEINLSLLESLSGWNHLPFLWTLADGPIFFLPLFLSIMWVYFVIHKKEDSEKRKLLHIFYVCVLGMVVSYIVKLFVDIDRPESYIESTRGLMLSHIPEKSFPSDHATISFAFVTSLFFTGFKRVGYIFLPLIICMNISRILVGVHWPLDIIVGTLLGITSGYVFFLYLRKLKLVKNLDLLIIKLMKYIKL